MYVAIKVDGNLEVGSERLQERNVSTPPLVIATCCTREGAKATDFCLVSNSSTRFLLHSHKLKRQPVNIPTSSSHSLSSIDLTPGSAFRITSTKSFHVSSPSFSPSDVPIISPSSLSE